MFHPGAMVMSCCMDLTDHGLKGDKQAHQGLFTVKQYNSNGEKMLSYKHVWGPDNHLYIRATNTSECVICTVQPLRGNAGQCQGHLPNPSF